MNTSNTLLYIYLTLVLYIFVITYAEETSSKVDSSINATTIIFAVYPPASTKGKQQITILGNNLVPVNSSSNATSSNSTTSSNNTSLVSVTVGPNKNYTLNSLCSKLMIVNSTTLVCDAPPGSGGQNFVAVYVDGILVATYSKYSYANPIIQFIYEDHYISTTGKTRLLITGSNFGGNTTTKRVTFQKGFYVHECTDVKVFHDHSSITCIAPAGSGVDNDVVVYVDGLSSNPYAVAYAAPEIDDVRLTVGTYGGWITINGDNFGKWISMVDVNIIMEDNVVIPCYDLTMLVPHFSLKCMIGEGVGGNGHIQICVDSQNNTDNNALFSYDPPDVYGVTFGFNEIRIAVNNPGPYMHNTVLKINYFNTDKNNNNNHTNQTLICNSVYLQYDEIVCSYSKTAFLRLSVSVVVGNQQSNNYTAYYPEPSISYFTTPELGSDVEIVGYGFGNDLDVVEVYLGHTKCTGLKYQDETGYVVFKFPDGYGSFKNTQVEVTIYVNEWSATHLIYVPTPIVNYANWLPDNKIGVKGLNFGNNDTRLTIQFRAACYSTYDTMSYVALVVNNTYLTSEIPPHIDYYSCFCIVVVTPYIISRDRSLPPSPTSTSSSGNTGVPSYSDDTSSNLEIYLVLGVITCGLLVVAAYAIRRVMRANAIAAYQQISALPNNPINQHQYGAVNNNPNININNNTSNRESSNNSNVNPIVFEDTLHDPSKTERVVCDICSEYEKVMVLNCGHMTCHGCSSKISICPFCKAPIVTKQRVYF